jgi:hypothetical protein
MNLQRTVNSVLTVCLSPRDHPKRGAEACDAGAYIPARIVLTACLHLTRAGPFRIGYATRKHPRSANAVERHAAEDTLPAPDYLSHLVSRARTQEPNQERS